MKTKIIPLLLLVLCSAQLAQAEITTPVIRRATFDSQGRLVVSVEHTGYAGCYLAINGGLNSSSQPTTIKGVQLDESDFATPVKKIRTVHRFYCKKRTLYVNAELTCLGEEVGAAVSDPVVVSVPKSNVRK